MQIEHPNDTLAIIKFNRFWVASSKLALAFGTMTVHSVKTMVICHSIQNLWALYSVQTTGRGDFNTHVALTTWTCPHKRGDC